MNQLFYAFDLLGTFAFSYFGATSGIKKNFNLTGVMLAAFLPAFGGGTIRALMLGSMPFYLKNDPYIIAMFAGVLLSIFLNQHIALKKWSQVFIEISDAIGLATFAIIAAQKCLETDPNISWFGIAFLSALTAAGGGILKDIFLNDLYSCFSSTLYPEIAALIGLLYIWVPIVQNPIGAIILVFFGVLTRIFVIKKNIRTPFIKFQEM
jgi:uncharacterized membrane protein YeiH